jgi:hypothetical protein
MRTKLGYGRRFAILFMAFFLALGTSLHFVQATSVMGGMAIAAGADGTHHRDCDGCSNRDINRADCQPAACPPGCGKITCATLPSGAVVRPVVVLAPPEPTFASLLGWLASPDPPPPRLLAQAA